MATIEALLEDLRAEESRLASEVKELEARQREVHKEIEKVRAGIAALTGKSPARRSRKRSTSGKKARASNGPRTAATTAAAAPANEIHAAVRVVLARGDAFPEEDLADRVGERLEAKGFSREGLHETLMRTLREGPFESSPTGWRLVEHTVKMESRKAATHSAPVEPVVG